MDALGRATWARALEFLYGHGGRPRDGRRRPRYDGARRRYYGGDRPARAGAGRAPTDRSRRDVLDEFSDAAGRRR